MVDLLNYIRNLIFAPSDSRKRRAPSIEDYEIAVSPKNRRINTSQMSNTLEDDWHSTTSSSSIRRRSTIHNSAALGARRKPSWCKENITLTIDDDDVIDISKPKQKAWLLEPLRVSGRMSHSQFTSTPNVAPARAHLQQNGDDDVMFLKHSLSSEDKKRIAKQQGFSYIKPCTYSNDLQNKYSSLQNGSRFKDYHSQIINRATEIKAKLHKRPVRSAVLDQSFRLEEKAKYKKLLAQESISTDAFSKYGVAAPVTSLFTFGGTGRGRKLVDLVIAKNKTSPIIDLTSTGTNGKKRSCKDAIKKVLSDFDNDRVTVKDSDSDVEILPAPPSPKPDIQVERVNSLEKVVHTAEPFHSEWLRQRVKKSQDAAARSQREIIARTTHKNKIAQVTSAVHSQRLEDKVEQCLHIKDQVLPVHIEDEAVFPELSDEDDARINSVLNKRGNANEVVAQKFGLRITRYDIQTLAGLNWLNDEVINFYMNLIIERGKEPNWPKAYAMNTFFYPKLQKDGPVSLRRWTRKIDIFAHDVIAVPIHLGVHWCMCMIDFRSKTINYYDSMGSTNRQCLEALLKYLQAEHLDKKKMELDVSDWSLESVPDIPQQMNGSDCGMFACTFAEFITRNAKINFSQENMPYLRRKMVLEILIGELLIK